MDDAFARRAAERRATWTGGVARSFDELEASRVSFWAEASPASKLTAMLQLLTDAYAIEGKNGPAPRFDASIVGIARFDR